MSEVARPIDPVETQETNSSETKVGLADKSSLLVDDAINLTSISAKSDSISSLSSIDTTNTSNNLIETLQSTRINEDEKNQPVSAAGDTIASQEQPKMTIKQIDPETLNTTITSQKLPKSVASKTNFYNDMSQHSVDVVTPTSPNSNIPSTSPLPKKAVKFTVRKVSHETIISPSSSPNLSNVASTAAAAGAGGKQRTSSHSRSHSHPEMGTTTFTAKTVASSSSSSMANETNQQEMAKLQKAQHKYEQYDARITKIEKEINFLTQLLPPYNVEVDYNTRVKITKAIEKLRMKQDEVDKKKYDLGITISRLWRNLDDGSNIWVRKGE
ncbi:hypothetical protein Cantr_00350 [Candida viswanathii]|uniref:Bud neck protein 5 n=1 Tax=Candida viswanathii TaxID=5486 RepID=A0A367YHN7_9ASCO|nr:hypothetical protein Cantr_00350 [Candida viswanathii]